MIGIALLVSPNFIKPRNHRTVAGGMLSPRQKLVLVFAKKRADNCPGGFDAAPLENLEQNRQCLSPSEHIRPIAFSCCVISHSPQQFEIEGNH